jgi:hypothetical protein
MVWSCLGLKFRSLDAGWDLILDVMLSAERENEHDASPYL